MRGREPERSVVGVGFSAGLMGFLWGEVVRDSARR